MPGKTYVDKFDKGAQVRITIGSSGFASGPVGVVLAFDCWGDLYLVQVANGTLGWYPPEVLKPIPTAKVPKTATSKAVQK